MRECKNCKNKIPFGEMMECPACGATFCMTCSNTTQKICPYCYSSLNYNG